jgi:hypothetical protein
MTDSDDVKEALIDNLKGGVIEKQIGDRRYRFHSPKEMYDVLKQLQADSANFESPFIRVKFNE